MVDLAMGQEFYRVHW